MNGTSKIMSELDQATLKGHNMRLLGPNLELYFWPFLTRGLHGDTQSPCSRAKKKKTLSIGKETSRGPINTKNQCFSFKRYGNFLIRDFIEIKFQMRKNFKMDCGLEKINIFLRFWLEKLESKEFLLNMH